MLRKDSLLQGQIFACECCCACFCQGCAQMVWPAVRSLLCPQQRCVA